MKTLLIATILVLSGYAQSQSLGLMADVGLVYPQPSSGPFHAAAIGFYLEPTVVFNEQIGVGLKLEMDAASTVNSGISSGGSSVSTNSQMAAITFMGTGDYYFGTNKSRLFAGGGLGYMVYARNYLGDGASLQDGSTGIGMMLRGGIVLGTCRLSAEYNMLLARSVSATVSNGSQNVKPHFWGLKFGWEIGGKRRYK